MYNFSLVEKLPKTRSGKILRGTIRKILDKENWKMPATIEDASALDLIQEIADSVAINRKEKIVFETMDKVNHKQIKIEWYNLFIYINSMGKIYKCLSSDNCFFSCKKCGTDLSSRKDVVSKNFRGKTGEAFLFTRVLNIKKDKKKM